MKKLIAIVMLLAAFGSALTARGEFRWGPTAGIAISNLKYKQTPFTKDQCVGPQAGVMGEMMFPGLGFGIDFGAIYSMEGAKLHLGEQPVWGDSYDGQKGYGTSRLYLHMIDIPINLRFKWTRMNGLEEWWAPYVFGGPVISLRVGESDIKVIDNPFGSIGLQCGVGFELKQRFQIQASYLWGMTYCTRMEKLTDVSGQARVWSVRVAYLF